MIQAVGMLNVQDESGAQGTRLLVQFSNGKIAEYKDVPVETFEAIVNAPSAGKEFGSLVKGKFPWRYVSAWTEG